jgi:hypothetical protein
MATECIESKAGADADRRMMWHACLHEAAHLVSANVLLNKAGTALVFADATGAAIAVGGVPASFKEAIVAAAGIYGDVMAVTHPPPTEGEPVPAEVADPQAAQQVLAVHGQGLSDRQAVVQWCVQDHETEPKSWAERYEWVMSATEEFVEEHSQEILDIAAASFARGIVTLPAQPEKGVEHVAS